MQDISSYMFALCVYQQSASAIVYCEFRDTSSNTIEDLQKLCTLFDIS